jgi:isopenicillin N synthase-like dioxygenase
MSEHADSGSVTLLFQTCSGLEVESPTGEWVAAPSIPGHILVNLGDALSFWSGGSLKATKHRVTFAGVPHDQERLTMAYFGKASPETVLEPITIEGRGKIETYESNGMILRPGITVGEYSKRIMEGIYGSSVAPKSELQGTTEVESAA